ncbi:potassium transporter KefB [Clostridium sp. AM28-20LB]|mgnify:CR=1 FL=1|uniref:potassium transporter KefB n=1 Tax=unclassified Clostridium TaxID=2614128 RepID=UPI000E53D8A1|nr:potassium transporter KefB [Clostridium sp. AM28-20LB]RHQ85081.1 potassium transporter KefB [Clostridium sp. AF22-10]RHT76889.1 potassium transporter KefB [Clostridium sp. AM28-20LB]
MQNQRQNGRPNAAVRMAGLFLVLFCVAAVLIPAKTLFTGNGFFADYIHFTESKRMYVEIAILAVLIFGGLALLKRGRSRMYWLLAVVLVFSWIHVVFLPMVVSAAYMLSLLAIGRFLRKQVFFRETIWERPYFSFYMDFLFGVSFAIVVYCILSALGVGKIAWMRLSVYALGVAALGFDFSSISCQCIMGWQTLSWMLDGSGGSREIPRRVRRAWTLAAGWCVLMFLIQVGRLNIALDFDTLWYGVRSQYIVAGGTGLYENPGLVGMVYVYSKGFEVLTLPLCDLASHSYLTFFNLWLAVLGIGAMVWNAVLLTGNRKQETEKKLTYHSVLPGIMAAVLTVSVPGIMNMALTAKADLITWLLQLIMLGCFFQYIHVYENHWIFLSGAAGSYFLTLTMKPTSLVFSTAVFGMMGLYLLWFWFHERGAAADLFHHLVRLIGSLCLPFGALVGIWARTMKITGMPVTSVFTSIFALFGFKMKYPFATSELPQNYQEESTLHVLARRIWQMLMQPQGEDMGHVILAWGTSLMAVLIVMLVLYGIFSKKGDEQSHIWNAALVIFFPFVIVSLISLSMLYQIDGNYFMLLYSMLILGACRAMVYFKKIGFYPLASKCLTPLLVLNLIVTAISSWAWTAGFSEIHLLNKGRVNHRAQEQARMEEKGNTLIWQEVSQDPENRVIAFGTHPYCLQFPCNVESYKDITSPWGNVELVNSPEAFETYMAYAKTDYVYVEAGYLGPGSWEWSLDLLRELIHSGSLTDLFFENGNMLARVSDTAVPEEEAQNNLEMFEREYLFYDAEAQ